MILLNTASSSTSTTDLLTTTTAEPPDGFSQIVAEPPHPPPHRPKKRWTSEKERELCELWKEEDHLYDATVKDYRNTTKRCEAMERFAAILGFDAKEVELHLRTLRTTFTKLSSLPPGSGDRLTARQRNIMDQCSFLQTHIKHRERSKFPRRKSQRAVNMYKAKAAAVALQEISSYFDDSPMPSEIPYPDGDSSVSSYCRYPSPQPSTFGVVTKKEICHDESEEFRENIKEEDREDEEDITAYEDEEEGKEEEGKLTYEQSMKRKTDVSKPKSDMITLMEGHTELLKELTSSVSQLATSSSSSEDTKIKPDNTDLWAQLLADKIRQMDKKLAERFKLYVDTIALEAMEGDWVPK